MYIEQKKPTLQATAVPSIFLGLSDRFFDFITKSPPPKDRNTTIISNPISVPNNSN